MDLHCNNKFSSLQVHIQSRLLYNCHRAYPERADLEWLESNPGMLFHTKTMLEDRRIMLENKSCKSCHHGCYKYEDLGLPSQRLLGKSDAEEKITDPHAPLETLQIMLSTDCNLACVYCGPEFSTRWQRELQQGEYALGEDTIKNDKWSYLWSKMKQKDRSTETKFFALVLKEIKLAKGLKRIKVLGGEPLLSNQLVDLAESVQDKSISLTIISGLGVSEERLKSILTKTKGIDLQFEISVESTGKFFEFIRYGSDWNDFKNKIEIIRNHGHNIEFISTMSNLCLFDFQNFYTEFADKGRINISPVGMRPHMLPHVMDDLSKEKCKKHIEKISDTKTRQVLYKMMDRKPNENERKNCGSYLKQLSSRRNMKLAFLPDRFLTWCGAN